MAAGASTEDGPEQRLIAIKREFGEFGGVNTSIEVSTTFTVMEASTLPAIFKGEVGPDKGACYVYGRSFNPTVRYLGRQLAALEGTEAAYPVSSGMAAISAALYTLCSTGDHIVASNAIYGGTHALLKSFLPQKSGISCSLVDITDLAAVRAAMQPDTKVLYTESIGNPTLVVADIPALAQLAHSCGAQLLVDNTFAPCVLSPARLGADVVLHSLTKFISGASDVVAGAICASAAFVQKLVDFHTGAVMLLGPTMDPRLASELSLRIPHLPLRMREHSARALALARGLQALGAKVTYPGLACHPGHALLARLANPGYGCGGLLGLDMGGRPRAEALMERLQNTHGFGFIAVSLGYADTLMSLSSASTSSELSSEELAAAGIAPGYVRMSIGFTGPPEQRWAQLQEAYCFVTGSAQSSCCAISTGALPAGSHLYASVVQVPQEGAAAPGQPLPALAPSHLSCTDEEYVASDSPCQELQPGQQVGPDASIMVAGHRRAKLARML